MPARTRGRPIGSSHPLEIAGGASQALSFGLTLLALSSYQAAVAYLQCHQFTNKGIQRLLAGPGWAALTCAGRARLSEKSRNLLLEL